MDVRRTFSLAPIHMSLSEVCSANPLKVQSTEAEQTAFLDHLQTETFVAGVHGRRTLPQCLFALFSVE